MAANEAVAQPGDAKQNDENQPLRPNNDNNNNDEAGNIENKNNKSEESSNEKDNKSLTKEASNAANECYHWFPLQLFAFIAGPGLLIIVVLDMIIYATTFTGFFVYVLLILFAVLITIIQMPLRFIRSNKAMKATQLWVYNWMRILSCSWGKSAFYLVVCVMCISAEDLVAWIGGIYFIILSILCLIASRLAAKKFHKIREYLLSIQIDDHNSDDDALGVVIDDEKNDSDDGMTNDDFEKKLIFEFNELNRSVNGIELNIANNESVNEVALAVEWLDAVAIDKLARKANIILCKSELESITTFLDESCNGYITKSDWIKQWTNFPKLAMM